MTTKTSNKTPSFSEFWNIYPLHRAKAAAERAWNRLSSSDKKNAVKALPAYTEYCKQKGIAYKYAQGWLNDRRWEDEQDNVQQSENQHVEHTKQNITDMETW